MNNAGLLYKNCGQLLLFCSSDLSLTTATTIITTTTTTQTQPPPPQQPPTYSYCYSSSLVWQHCLTILTS